MPGTSVSDMAQGYFKNAMQGAAADRAASAQQLENSKLQSKMAWDQWMATQQKAAEDKAAGAELGSGFAKMIANYNEAYGQAKQANETRYQDMLGIADQTTNQRMADVSSAYGNQQSDSMQNLARLGMGNTTVAPTMQMGIEREKQSALNRTADEMQGTKLGIMEKKTDNYPDLGSLQSIIAGAGSAFGTSGVPAMVQAFGNIRSY